MNTSAKVGVLADDLRVTARDGEELGHARDWSFLRLPLNKPIPCITPPRAVMIMLLACLVLACLASRFDVVNGMSGNWAEPEARASGLVPREA